MKSTLTTPDKLGFFLIAIGLVMISVAFYLIKPPAWLYLGLHGIAFLIVGCALLENDETEEDDTSNDAEIP